MLYTNEQCPVCGKKFTETDDIVVCPECGTPHHRQCYKDNRGCANGSRHGEGFVWKKTVTDEASQNKSAPIPPVVAPFGDKPKYQAGDDGHKVIFCPNCGTENPAEEPVCQKCGARLYNTQNGGRPFVPPILLPNMANQQFKAKDAIPISPLDNLGKNTVCDTAEFIGTNADKYIPKMYKLEKEKKKASWNWAAFLFSPYWFFYRKIPTVGIILMAIMLLVSGFCTTRNVLEKQTAVSKAMTEFYDGKATQEQVMNIYYDYMKTPEVIVTMGVTLLIHLYSGIMANYHYKKKAEKDVQNIKKSSQNPEQYRMNLFRKGGVSALMLILSLMGYYCASGIVSMIVSAILKL